MSLSRVAFAVLAMLAVILVAASALCAADWPAYRHDAARSGVTPEKLPAQLHLQWTHRPKHPPQPAWPEPGKELHRMPFDYAYQAAVASGTVYFGSSADNRAYALDLATGQERWSEAEVQYLKVKYVFPAFTDWIARALLRAGESNVRLERYDKARTLLQQLINDYPDSPVVARAREILERLPG